MKKYLTILLLFAVIPALAQKQDIRRGNRQFSKGNYAEADISYRKALVQDSTSVAARYNLANNLYRQGSFDEAAKQMDAVKEAAKAEPFYADFCFNRGDIALALQDWGTAVDSFAEYLKEHPGDIPAKENYTYAKRKQQEQENQNQDQNQNQDGSDNQDQKDQDRQPPKEDPRESESKEDRKQDQQPQPVEISPQQAQQILQAIQEKERDTQEKVDKEKAKALKSRQKEKNW